MTTVTRYDDLSEAEKAAEVLDLDKLSKDDLIALRDMIASCLKEKHGVTSDQ